MHAVSGSISPPGVLFAFPHGTCSLSVDDEYLALRMVPHVQTGFHVSRPTYRALSSTRLFSYGAISPTMAGFPAVLISRLLKSTRLFLRFRLPLLSEFG